MKDKLLFILLFFSSISIQAQFFVEMKDSEILTLIKKKNACLKEKNEDCGKYILEAIEKSHPEDLHYDNLWYIYAVYLADTEKMDEATEIVNQRLEKAKPEIVKDAFYNFKSAILHHQGKVAESIEILVELAKRLEKREDWDKLSITYLNLGIHIYTQHSESKALYYYLKAYETVKKTDNKTFESKIIGGIAECYFHIKDTVNSVKWSEKALKLPVEAPMQKEGVSTAHRNLARIYSNSNPKKSLYHINKAIEITEPLGVNNEYANALQIKAELLRKAGKYEEAVRTIEKSLEIAKKRNAIPPLVISYRIAARIYYDNELYKKSAESYREAQILNDSLRNETSVKAINELTEKYETEKKERQIAEQELEIQKKSVQMRNWTILGIFIVGGFLSYFYIMRRNQKNTIKIMEKEKENEILSARVLGEEVERSRISKELHDGIASNLVAVKLQIENNAEISQKILSLVQETHKEVRQIAHNLMPINFDYQNLVEVIKSFCEECTTENRPVNFQTNTEKVKLDKDRSIVLYRVVQEFIQNAIKHSQAKQIDVLLMENDNVITLNIEDNGIGFDTKIKETSKGLSGVIERLKKINGHINIDSSDRGTSVFISIKS